MLVHEVINVDVEVNACRLFCGCCGKGVFDVTDFANRQVVHSMVTCEDKTTESLFYFDLYQVWGNSQCSAYIVGDNFYRLIANDIDKVCLECCLGCISVEVLGSEQRMGKVVVKVYVCLSVLKL